MIRGIIFDLDGTLLDSLEERISAWQQAFIKFGVDVDRKTIRPLIGLPGKDLAGRFHERKDEIDSTEEMYFGEVLPQIPFFPDVELTMRKLRETGIRLFIVTSSSRKTVNMLSLPVKDVVTIDDVSHGKPGTEPYEKAIALMDLAPASVMVAGDSENDMIPARKLGCISVLVRHAHGSTSHYADYYIDEIAEIIPLLNHLNGKTKIRKR